MGAKAKFHALKLADEFRRQGHKHEVFNDPKLLYALKDTFLHILNNIESVRGNKRMRKEQRLYHPKMASRHRLLPRSDSPVLTRLRQEIVKANEKFNASQVH